MKGFLLGLMAWLCFDSRKMSWVSENVRLRIGIEQSKVIYHDLSTNNL